MYKNKTSYVKPVLTTIRLCHEHSLMAGSGPKVDDKDPNGGITTGVTKLKDGDTEEVEYELEQ